MQNAVSGRTCPACGRRLVDDGAGTFVCEDCDEAYEVVDMYLP